MGACRAEKRSAFRHDLRFATAGGASRSAWAKTASVIESWRNTLRFPPYGGPQCEKCRLAYALVNKAADDRTPTYPMGTAHDRSRMATVATPVAGARRLDQCRGVHVGGVHAGWRADMGGQPQG